MPPWAPPEIKISWGDLAGIPQPVQKFAAAPIGFIVGALLDTLLGGVETILKAFLGAIVFVFEGDSVGSTAGMWGIADIPRFGANLLAGAFGSVGGGLLDALDGLFVTLQVAVSAAGPAAPLFVGGSIAVAIVVAAYVAQFVWTLAVDTLNPL